MIFNRTATRNRRRWERSWLNSSIRVLASGAEINGFGIKVSEGGMYLFAVADLPVGSQVNVEFKPPQSQEMIRVAGTVRHRAVYLYGLEFV